MEDLHFWYSERQREITETPIFYLSALDSWIAPHRCYAIIAINGEEVEVQYTECSSEMLDHKQRFSDSIYLGQGRISKILPICGGGIW